VKDPILERIRGATFVLDPVAVGPQDEAGHYDPEKHTVTIFGSALNTLFLTSQDVGGSDFFTHAVIHEIGHAIDFESYAKAKRKVAELTQQLKDAKQIKVDPNAPIIDDKSAQKQKETDQKIKDLAKDLAKAEVEFDKIYAEQIKVTKPEEGAARAHSKEFSEAKARRSLIGERLELGRILQNLLQCLFSILICCDP